MHRIPELLRRNSLIGAAIVGPDGRFWEVNQKLCEILGYEESQLLQLNFKQISHPDDLHPDVNPYRLVESGKLRSFTLRKRYKHGESGRWVHCILVTEGFYNDAGKFLYYFSQVGEASDTDLSVAEDRRLSRIKQAIFSGSFVLHYQPIVSLETQQTHGYEALARWQDGSTLKAPDQFLPLLRKGHCEHLLCYWVIEQASQAQQSLDKFGQWVSFNISPVTVARADWVEQILPVGSHLEILESEMISDQIQSRLERARKRGLKITLDDFGTGYCSYDRLLDNKVDLVKIDKSIIKGLPESKPTTMVKAIVGLCKTLGIETIAEGVETEDQASVLKAIGCELAQGWLFGKAAPLEIGRTSLGASHP